jgi:hypothetical protein
MVAVRPVWKAISGVLDCLSRYTHMALIQSVNVGKLDFKSIVLIDSHFGSVETLEIFRHGAGATVCE